MPKPQPMSGGRAGRLSGRSVSERRCNRRPRARETGLSGLGQNLDQPNKALFPVPSLPGPVSSPTSSCFPATASRFPLALLDRNAYKKTNNQRTDFLITTTPVADLTQPSSDTPIFFPQFVDGGGYTTSLILMKTSGSANAGTLQILDGNGNPFVVNQAGGTSDSSFRYAIYSHGIYRFQTDGFPENAKAGWVRLIPDPGTDAPVGSGVFGYNPADILVSESGIPSAAATTHARVYVDLSGGHNTGLAIANISDTGNSIAIHAYRKDGSALAGVSQEPLSLPANGYAAAFASQFISGLPIDFTGVLDISSGTPFSALTLRSLNNERGDFLMTAFPIADQTQPAPAPIVFPHIVHGGGYTTQFILISAGNAGSATLFFHDATGASSNFIEP